MKEVHSNQRFQPLIALADLFDCSIDYLVGRSDEPKREVTIFTIRKEVLHMNKEDIALDMSLAAIEKDFSIEMGTITPELGTGYCRPLQQEL